MPRRSTPAASGSGGTRACARSAGPTDLPLAAYRWEHTAAARTAQLEPESEGALGVIEPGRAGVRFSNSTTGKDALVTVRTEMRRLRQGTRTVPVRSVGSAVWQVFDGETVATGDKVFDITRGDLFVVPSLVRGHAHRTHTDRPVPFQRRARVRGAGSRAYPPRREQMKLATIRVNGITRAVRIDEDKAVDLGESDMVAFLRHPDWSARAEAADGERYEGALDYAPVVVAPEKVVCVGLNYRNHILEMGRELPRHPTLFSKYARALVGAYDDVVLPASSTQMDWEAELAVVIGAEVRHAGPEQARAAIAGYTVLNDVTARDWQFRTAQWHQGKTFEATTPIGPWLVTADDPAVPAGNLELACEVDGDTVQKADTADLVFDPVTLVSYLSEIVTLVPGDVIATGTPGGVGHARKPARYLEHGSLLVTRIEGLGECRNMCRREAR
ncbi:MULTISPECIES: fumarylacetoacetate hydrolase family protein [Streptomyces]|nr:MULTISPECIES: fumarylacetoacetate hydrolase family protein [Streptomyces]